MQEKTDLLEDLKKRLLAVIQEYKTSFGQSKKTENSPSSTAQTTADNKTNDSKPAEQKTEASSNNISGSVGKGGTNNPEDVKKVQNLLNKNGCNLAIDGVIGSATIEAITKFQISKLGFSDGIIEPGKNSWRVLSGQKPQLNNKPAATTSNNQPAVSPSTTLSASVGMRGTNNAADVLLVKTLLNKFGNNFSTTDASSSKVGPTTIEAIKKFQTEKAGLTDADGLIEPGKNTWKILSGETQPTAATAAPAASAAGYNAALGQELAKRARSVANSMRTVGRCYAGTCKAVNGFLGKPILYGMSAYMAAKLLAAQPKLFKEISASSTTLTSLPTGTIVVWSRGKARKRGEPVTQPHPQHGHIMICLGGGQEASDHVNRIIFQGCGVSCRAFIPISKG